MRSVFKRDTSGLLGGPTYNRHLYHATALKRHYNRLAKTGMGYFIFFSAKPRGRKGVPRSNLAATSACKSFFLKGFADSEFCFLICVTEQAHSFTSTFPESRNMETSLTLNFDFR
jgi:hypothetical protein